MLSPARYTIIPSKRGLGGSWKLQTIVSLRCDLDARRAMPLRPMQREAQPGRGDADPYVRKQDDGHRCFLRNDGKRQRDGGRGTNKTRHMPRPGQAARIPICETVVLLRWSPCG